MPRLLGSDSGSLTFVSEVARLLLLPELVETFATSTCPLFLTLGICPQSLGSLRTTWTREKSTGGGDAHPQRGDWSLPGRQPDPCTPLFKHHFWLGTMHLSSLPGCRGGVVFSSQERSSNSSPTPSFLPRSLAGVSTPSSDGERALKIADAYLRLQCALPAPLQPLIQLVLAKAVRNLLDARRLRPPLARMATPPQRNPESQSDNRRAS